MAKELESKERGHVSVRLDDELTKKLDQITVDERRGTRSDTIRALLDEALDARKPRGRRREFVSAK